MEIRPYEPADREACIAIFQSRIGTFFSANEASDFELLLEDLEGEPDFEEEVRFFVGVESEKVVAMGGFEVLGEASYLTWGTVHADHGGRGLGRALLEARLTMLRGWSPAVGSVFSDTTPEVAGFYAKFGFQPFFEKAKHWGGEFDLVAMELCWDDELRGPRRIREDGSLGYRVASA